MVRATVLGILIVLGACRRSEGDDPTALTAPTADSGPLLEDRPKRVEDSLDALGVDRPDVPRVAEDGTRLDVGYAPLGGQARFGVPAEGEAAQQAPALELWVVGPSLDGLGSGPVNLVELGGAQGTEPQVLHSVTSGTEAWTATSGPGNATDAREVRAAVAGDLDQDGFDEVVIATLDDDPEDPAIVLRVVDDPGQGFAEREARVARAPGSPIYDLALAMGDVRGDTPGLELLVAASKGDRTELQVVRLDGTAVLEQGEILEIAYTLGGDPIGSAEIAVGNLDYDQEEEIVVVVNETDEGTGGDSGIAHYAILDDRSTSYQVRAEGRVDAGGVLLDVAGAAIGDVDGDGLGEVVLAGLDGFETCAGPFALQGAVVVRDDLVQGLSVLRSTTFDARAGFGGCPGSPWALRYAHVTAFDMDGDGLDEIGVNQVVYDDLTSGFEPLPTPGLGAALLGATDGGARLNGRGIVVAPGDFDADGREDLAVYNPAREHVAILGRSPLDDGFGERARVGTAQAFSPSDALSPLLLSANVDVDSAVLDFSEGSYQLVFTEPVVIAALAAAPCADGIGQNVDACRTSFGQADSQAVSAELAVSVSAGVHVGIKAGGNIPFVGEVGTSLKTSVKTTATLSQGIAYEVVTSRVFNTGPLEDGVVFTSIPYDQYTYEILSHPDPALVGLEVVVSLPRAPVVLKTERSFYNANVIEGALQIDERVFDHTPGVLESYPDRSRKNRLLSTYGGLENGPVGVGEGTGSTQLGIEVAESVSLGASLGIEFETQFEATAGRVLAGYTVGYGVKASLTLRSGERTSFAARVGDIEAARFGEERYTFGMMTYPQALDGQSFEVLNFWIE